MNTVAQTVRCERTATGESIRRRSLYQSNDPRVKPPSPIFANRPEPSPAPPTASGGWERVAVVLTALVANLQTGRHLDAQDRVLAWSMVDRLARCYVAGKHREAT